MTTQVVMLTPQKEDLLHRAIRDLEQVRADVGKPVFFNHQRNGLCPCLLCRALDTLKDIVR